MMEHLSLQVLRQFDHMGREHGPNWRFCCPLCGADKPKDKSHQSLSVKAETGLWECWRCHQKGKLTDFWEERSRGKEHRAQVLRAFPAQAPAQAPPPKLAEHYGAFVRAFPGSPGEAYLERRGIPGKVARKAGVGYCGRWGHFEQHGKEWVRLAESRRVVFPVVDQEGQLQAIQGRSISPEEYGPKILTRGATGQGWFAAPGAGTREKVIVVEGPVNALTLYALGFPAGAVCGTQFPLWLAKACQGKLVYLASDHDEPDRLGKRPGDEAARRWEELLTVAGALTLRLRPPDTRDWNDLLLADWRWLRQFLTEATA